MRKSILALLLAVVMLTGTLPIPTAAAAATTADTRHSAGQSAENVLRWRLKGKIAVQTADNAGSSNIQWIQRNNKYSIALSGPMGSTSLLLVGRPGSVQSLDANGRRNYAESPEELLASQWGFHLPVSNMIYWVRGLPVPDMPASVRYDKAGHLATLTQDGFRVTYFGYVKRGDVYLPQKFIISSPRLRVKMIVYEWRI